MLLLDPLLLFSSFGKAIEGHPLSKESNVVHLFPVQAEVVQDGLSLPELSSRKSDLRQLLPCSHSFIHSFVHSFINLANAYFMPNVSALSLA